MDGTNVAPYDSDTPVSTFTVPCFASLYSSGPGAAASDPGAALNFEIDSENDNGVRENSLQWAEDMKNGSYKRSSLKEPYLDIVWFGHGTQWICKEMDDFVLTLEALQADPYAMPTDRSARFVGRGKLTVTCAAFGDYGIPQPKKSPATFELVFAFRPW